MLEYLLLHLTLINKWLFVLDIHEIIFLHRFEQRVPQHFSWVFAFELYKMATKTKLIMVQTPAEKLFEIRSIINLMGTISGLSIIQKDYKMNIITHSLLVLICIIVSFTIYTLVQYMDNLFLQLQTICVYGVTISVSL